MASQPVELPLSIWAPPGSPLRVEYSGGAMEEIRARAVNGFYKVRGGVDVAGLLVGAVQPQSIRVLAQLPFEIEYAHGPSFVLSGRDLALVRKLIEDVSSAGLEAAGPGGAHRVLGLYVSHARSDLALSAAEIQVFDQLFPHAWQTVLLLKPSHSTETAAAFFVREPSGEIHANGSYGVFSVAPAMGDRRARPAHRESSSLRALAEAARLGSGPESSSAAAPPAAESPARPGPPQPAAPDVAPLHPPLFEEDTLARRAIPEPPPRPLPPSIAPDERAAFAVPEAPASPQLDLPLEQPIAEPRDIERLSLPEPLAALLVDADVPAEAGALVSAADAPEWHEEELPPGGVRATSWLRWAIPSAALALLVVLGYLVYHALNSVPPSVVFFRRAAGGGQEIVWRVQGMGDARSAVITIRNGTEIRTIDLKGTGQLSGVYRHPSLTSASAVTLDIERSTGEKIHREAPPLEADSVVPYLGGFTSPETDGSPAPGASSAASLGDGGASPQPILATPVPNTPSPVESEPPLSGSLPPASVAPPAPVPSPPATADERVPEASTPRPAPEVPVQARVTEAPREPRPEIQAVASAAKPNPAPDSDSRQPPISPNAPSPAITPPPSATAPAAVENRAAPQPRAPQPQAPPARIVLPPAPAKAKPERAAAGRILWTGQLDTNQTLKIDGKAATAGWVSAALPGQPVRVSVFPGEITSQGMVVYTADPRYRNAANAVESPSDTNGWNQTRYRYDPGRAQSLIVTVPPNEANGWRSITMRNEQENISLIVINWQVQEP